MNIILHTNLQDLEKIVAPSNRPGRCTFPLNWIACDSAGQFPAVSICSCIRILNAVSSLMYARSKSKKALWKSDLNLLRHAQREAADFIVCQFTGVFEEGGWISALSDDLALAGDRWVPSDKGTRCGACAKEELLYCSVYCAEYTAICSPCLHALGTSSQDLGQLGLSVLTIYIDRVSATYARI